MRLFFSINFDEKTKNSIFRVVETVKTAAVSGTFTTRNNYHVTLAFLGEIESVALSGLRSVMMAISTRPFVIEFSKTGTFTPENDPNKLIWIGTEENAVLGKLASDLRRALSAASFRFDKKAFQPHLTVGREVRFKEGAGLGSLPAFSPFIFSAKQISLIESTRENGNLVYREIAKRLL